jgi:hypothetical protein
MTNVAILQGDADPQLRLLNIEMCSQTQLWRFCFLKLGISLTQGSSKIRIRAQDTTSIMYM